MNDTPLPWSILRSAFAAVTSLACPLFLTCLPASAATVYWDINGSAAGAGGASPSGTWSSVTEFWNSLADGTGVPAAWTPGNIAAFSAGLDATGPFTVTVDGVQSISGLRFERGQVTLSEGTLSLAADSDAFVASSVQATLNSLLTGSTRFTKTGEGSLTLTGQSSGFTGAMVLQEGTLRAIGPNTHTLGQGTLELNGGTLHLMNNGNITLGRNTTLNGAASIIADGLGTGTAVDTTFTFGTLNVATASSLSVTRGSSITGSLYGRATFGATTLAENLTVNLGERAITTLGAITESGGSRTLVYNGVSSSSSILILNGASTHTGGIIINSGRVYANVANSLGAVGTQTQVNAGTLDLRNANSAVDRHLIYNGTATLNLINNGTVIWNVGSLTHTAGNLTISSGPSSSTNVTPRVHTLSADVALNGNLTLASAVITTFIMKGAVSEVGGISRNVIKSGLGLVRLDNIFSHSGTTTISNGILQLGVDNALPSGAMKGNVSMNPGNALTAVLDLNGFDQTLNGISNSGLGTSRIDNTAAEAVTLTLGAGDASGLFTGAIQNTGGALTLIKTGSGVQALMGTNTYTGGTFVNGGVLVYGNLLAQPATGTTEVAAAGTLGLGVGGTGFYSSADVDALFANTLANVNMAAGASVGIDTTAGDFEYTTSQSAARGLAKTGPNVLTLSGNNTYTGDTLLAGGTLSISSDSSLGAATGALTMFSGTTLRITGSNNPTSTRNITLQGAATFEVTEADNTVTLTSGLNPSGIFTKAGPGTLRLTGNVTNTGNSILSGGMLIPAGIFNTGAGTTTVGSAGSPGTLLLGPGSEYTTTTLAIGTAVNSLGSVIIRGGDVDITTEATSSGVGLGSTGYGGLFMSAGSLTTNRVDSLDGTTPGAVSVIQITGGTLNTRRYIMFRNEHWEFTVKGGEVLRTGEHIALGFRGSATASGAMTVAGGLVDNSGFLVTFGQQNNTTALATTHLNLNGGTLITGQLLHYNNTGTNTTSAVNFNGGLLKASVATSLFLGTTGSGGTSTLKAYVNGAFGSFAGGARIDTNGVNVTIPTPLVAPTGNGVASIPVTAGGSGYIGAPYVEITGGGGTGATASAVVDMDPASLTYGQLLSIVVTNPGIGYTSEPTITLIGGGGSGTVLGTATTAVNTSGGLTKTGEGTLTLSGASTYTGGTFINEGTLALGINNALFASGSVTLDGGVFDLVDFSNSVAGVTLLDGGITGVTGVLTSTSDYDLRQGSVSANLGGSVGLNKTTAGTVALSAASSFTGPVNVTGGTLAFAAADNLGSGGVGNTISVNAATLSYSGSGSMEVGGNRVLTIGAGGAALAASDAAGVVIYSAGVTTVGSGPLTKSGPGTVVLAGTTDLNGGSLMVTEGRLSAGFGTDGIASLTVGSAGNMDFSNGATQTLSGLIGLTLQDGARLGFELDAGFNDSLNALVAASVTGTINLDFFNTGSGVSATTYSLISAPGGLLGGSFVVGQGITGWNLTLNATDTLVSITASQLQQQYWRGGHNSSWAALGSGPVNWTTDAAGLVAASQIPSTGEIVAFSAANAPFTSGSEITTTLDAAFTLGGLIFDSAPAGISAVTLNPGTGGTLTLAPQSSLTGLDVLDNAGAVTISAPLIAMSNQTWLISGTGASLAITGSVEFNQEVIKKGAGTLTLSGPGTGSGGIRMDEGTLNLNSPTAAGSGTLIFATGTSVGNTSAGPVTLTTNNPQVWNESLTFTGSQSLNMGAGAVSLRSNITLSAVTETFTIGGIISDAGNGFGLTKTGPGTLALGGLNSYGGATVLNEGTLVFAANQNLTAATNTLTLGSEPGSTSAFALNLTTGSATFGGPVLVQTNNTVANTVSIGAGQTLQFNSSLTIGYNSELASRTRLTLSGDGTFKIGDVGSPTNAPVQVGNGMTTSISNAGLLDMSGLATFYANLGTGIFRVGDTVNGGGGAGAGGGGSTVILAANSTLIASMISTDSQTLAPQTISLGSGTNSLFANTHRVGGAAARGNGILNFHTSTGTVLIRNSAGNDRAVMTVMSATAATAGALFGTLDFAGHYADILLSSLSVGTRSAGSTGAGTGTFTFDTGILDATTVILGSRTGTTMTSALITGTMNLGGTTAGTEVIFGSLTMGTNTVSSATSTGNTVSTLNISGIGSTDIGTLTMGNLSVTGSAVISSVLRASGITATVNISGSTTTLGSLSMAVNSSNSAIATTAASALNISGGSVSVTGGIHMGATSVNELNIINNEINITGTGSLTVGGDITYTNGIGTENISVTLDGGSLDMGGFGIGSASAPVVFNAGSGSLQNLAALNDGAGLVKTTSGSLIVAGVNAYAGPTTVSDGVFQLGNGTSGSLTGTGLVTVVKTGTDLSAAPVFSGGSNGVLGAGVIAGSVLIGDLDVAGNRGILAPGLGNTATSNQTLIIQGESGLTVAGGSQLQLSITLPTLNDSDLLAALSSGTQASVLAYILDASPTWVTGAPDAFGDHDYIQMTTGPLYLGSRDGGLGNGTVSILDHGYSSVAEAGDVFNLLDWTGLMGGSFNANGTQYSIGGIHGDFDLPSLPGNLAWDTSAFTSHGVLAVIIVPEPGHMQLLLLGLFGILHHRRRPARRQP
ncbi:autotransporter-associated beta strand repeat-containing protein [Prosthecobacter sp. SYSU 5D2]|uniref:beta strand repeat-containing protein n=1 Tax=Prosthecobacter sp. SYSU 5D2 TaxID=3134134 RepID=UPI0031FEFE03